MKTPPDLSFNEPVASQKDVNELKGWMIGVMIVLGILVVTLVLQYFTASETAFQDLKDQVTAQNAKMDVLIEEYGVDRPDFRTP